MKNSQVRFPVIAGIGFALLLIASPVIAAGMTTWGVNGGGAPAMLSFGTKGVAFIIIWIVEAVVLRFYLKIPWTRAIFGSLALNAFSTLCGIVLSLVAFTMPLMTWLALGIFLLLSYRIFFVQGKIPEFYGPILLLTMLIGSIVAYRINGLVPPVSPILAWLMIITTLLTGYGITVGLEALICGKLLVVKNAWDGILRANLVSFLILILMIPFFPGNLYDGNEDNLKSVLSQKIIDGADSSEMVNNFNHFAASNFFILGLSKDSSPPDQYWAGLELDVLNLAYSAESETFPDPETGLAIAGNALSYGDLFEDSEEDLTFAEKYFGHWSRALKAKENGDTSTYISETIAWTTWYQTTDVPGKLEDLPEPNSIIESLGAAKIKEPTE